MEILIFHRPIFSPNYSNKHPQPCSLRGYSNSGDHKQLLQLLFCTSHHEELSAVYNGSIKIFLSIKGSYSDLAAFASCVRAKKSSFCLLISSLKNRK